MEKRLILARTLLKDTGVIIVAIGDDEHHRLRMLMDQIFGEQNFLANITWQGITKSDSRFGGQGVDYMLAYGRDSMALIDADVRWKDRKKGFDEILEASDRIWKQEKGDPIRATAEYRKWFKAANLDVDKSTKLFDTYDESGRLFQKVSVGSPSPRANLMYDVLHPVSGKPVAMPPNGWAVNREKMLERIEANLIVFGKDERSTPRRKSFFDELSSQEPQMVFHQGRSRASGWLKGILGDRRFPFPKDHEVLMRWFRMVAPKDAVILDFFGGSGTTAEAVIRLNAEDGGTRQSILVTNNELSAKDDAALRKAGHEPGSTEYEAKGVFHHVTKPRIETVVSGTRQDGSSYSGGLPGRVTFFDLEYLDADRIADDRAFEAILPMLWIRAGAHGALEPSVDAPWLLSGNYAVLRDAGQWKEFSKTLTEKITHVFIVTNSSSEFSRAARSLPQHVEAVRLYERYLTTFEINTGEEVK